MKWQRILIICVIVITVALLLLQYMQIDNYRQNVNNNNNHIIAKYLNNYNTTVYMYRLLAKTYYEEIILNKSELLDIIEQANYAVDEETKALLRKKLIEKTYPMYENVLKNHFDQVHFQTADVTSFLRMHALDTYGDKISNFRDTLRIANEERKYVEGFEVGVSSTAYRFVFPLFNKNHFIGTVELSISYASLIDTMDSLYNIRGLLLVKKSEVDSKMYDEFLDNYFSCLRMEGYYCEREVYNLYFDSYGSKYVVEEINNRIIKNKNRIDESDSSFIINTKIEGEYYSAIHLNILDINKENMGYLVFYEKNQALNYYEKELVLNSLLIVLLWIVFIIVFLLLRWANKKIENIIGTDSLTNAYNRNKFYEIFEAEIKRKDRYDNSLSLIMYDIDRFKKINDKFGHNSGDIVLKKLTQLVKDNIRETDYLFRWGGEEFMIALPNTELVDAVEVAEKLRKLIEIYDFNINGLEKVTVSFGVVEYNKDEPIYDLINRADELLYDAKRAGRNQVKF